MKTAFTELLADETGASMVEYGLLIALIAMVAFTAVSTLGRSLSSFYASAGGSI